MANRKGQTPYRLKLATETARKYKRKGSGWPDESFRHSQASMGIKTSSQYMKANGGVELGSIISLNIILTFIIEFLLFYGKRRSHRKG